jgi:hypothetical protein
MAKKDLTHILCIDNDEEFKINLADKFKGKFSLLFFDENIDPQIPFQFIEAIGGIDLGLVSLDSSRGIGIAYLARLKTVYPASLLITTASDLQEGAIRLLESSLSGRTLLLDKNYVLENLKEYLEIDNYSFISILIVTSLGTYNLMTACKTLSSEGISITLECILISKLSKVAVPLPQGDFLVVIFNFLVGRGIGPDIGIPAFEANSLI